MTRRIRMASLTVALLFFVVSAPSAHADVWGAAYGAAVLSRTLTNIQNQIDGVLLATLKSTAVTLLNTRVMSLVGGSSVGTSQVITDWKAYLYTQPETKVTSAMDNFYATTLRSRSSASGYVAASGQSSYESYLEARTKSQLSTAASTTTATTGTALLSEVSSDPAASIGNGDIRVFSAMTESGSDPFGYALKAQGYQMAVREQEQKAAQVQAAASAGYKGVKDDKGNVILPGATIGLMVANTQDIGNKVIAAASNPGELVGGVISSLTNKMITNLIQKGVGSVQSSIQREITSVDNKIMGQVTTVNTALGTGAKYTAAVKQQTTTNLNAAGSGAAIPILK